jgi:hypothetical protein
MFGFEVSMTIMPSQMVPKSATADNTQQHTMKFIIKISVPFRLFYNVDDKENVKRNLLLRFPNSRCGLSIYYVSFVPQLAYSH